MAKDDEVTVVGPDWALAFAQLAPLITEANMLAQDGRHSDAADRIAQAYEIIKSTPHRIVLGNGYQLHPDFHAPKTESR